MNTLGIDVATKDAPALMALLIKHPLIVGASGPFPYREDANESQVHVDTNMGINELEDWLYDRINAPYVGVFLL